MAKKNYASRTIRGKLRVCRYLLTESHIGKYVPRTVKFNRLNLEMMCSKYSSLYVKPDIGSLGIGICKIKKSADGYVLQRIVGKRQLKEQYRNVSDIYASMNRSKQGSLIIQQGIGLDRVNNRPYDIRVMVQRKPGGSWVCTGYMVKVGVENKIVTNYYQGGSIYTLNKLHSQLQLTKEEGERRRGRLTTAALDVAKVLSKKKSGMHEMGIDFAYDSDRRLWILEVNSNHPQFHPLKSINRKAFDKMKEYAASYGRYDAK
ncbi:YheC/YheD family protein [Paenibacillus sp. GSMTC-2017]|uniref:YheC/YheD family protein n=1 Tax=Paenibacillus sp. GSMTC-2017 TaxID=2794350 RepID=UPI0018D93CF2|nr:YheC/YheD family protein [Paenibacillus sp. GSMTC-2017]MBH5319172.1 YheC/YheD family protein [Paenibacillus sp. GSMTC-2017]